MRGPANGSEVSMEVRTVTMTSSNICKCRFIFVSFFLSLGDEVEMWA